MLRPGNRATSAVRRSAGNPDRTKERQTLPLVHALWSPGRGLLLWAEHDRGPAGTSSRSAHIALPHPFAVSSADLTALHPGKPTSVTLLLPSRANRPLASSEPAASGKRRGSALSLRPWS